MHFQSCHLVVAPVLALILGAALFAQRPPKIGYSSQEEYCRENPKMPTCIDGSKLNLKGLTQSAPGIKVKPQAAPAARPRHEVRDWRIPMSAQPLPAGQAQAHFPPPSAGILISVRPKALLGSKLLGNLAASSEPAESSQALEAAVDLDEVRVAVGSTAKGQNSMLMMATAPTPCARQNRR